MFLTTELALASIINRFLMKFLIVCCDWKSLMILQVLEIHKWPDVIKKKAKEKDITIATNPPPALLHS